MILGEIVYCVSTSLLKEEQAYMINQTRLLRPELPVAGIQQLSFLLECVWDVSKNTICVCGVCLWCYLNNHYLTSPLTLAQTEGLVVHDLQE